MRTLVNKSIILKTIMIIGMMFIGLGQQYVYAQIPVTDGVLATEVAALEATEGLALSEETAAVLLQNLQNITQQATLTEETAQTALQTSELAAQGDLLTYLTTNIGIGTENTGETPSPLPITVLGHLTAIQDSIGNNAVPYEARTGTNLLNLVGGNDPSSKRRTIDDILPTDLLTELMYIDQSLTTPVIPGNRIQSPFGTRNLLGNILESGLIRETGEEVLKYLLVGEAGCQLGVATLDIADTIKNFFDTYDEYHAKTLPETYLAQKTNNWSIETGAMVLGMYLSLGAQYGAFIKDYLQSNAMINASRQAQGVLQAIQLNSELENILIQQIQKSRVIEMEHLALDLSNTLKDADYRAIKEAHSSQLMVKAILPNDIAMDKIRY